MCCNDLNTQFRKIILRYIKIGYITNVIRQTACMVVNPITVNNFASLFGCAPAGWASDYDGSGLKTLSKPADAQLSSGEPESNVWFSYAPAFQLFLAVESSSLFQGHSFQRP